MAGHAHAHDMDGLVEPSMPTLPSVVNQMKDMQISDQRKSSMDENEAVLYGITADKKKFSYSAAAARKTKTPTTAGIESSIDLAAGPSPSAATYKIRLSAAQQKDIADAFNAFDVHGTGYMSTVDLRVALKALGFEARTEEMKKIREKWDRGYTGKLCYADFMNVIEDKLAEHDTREDILKAFKLFDKDHTGRIALHNLRQVADELGEDCNDEELAEMLAEADLDEDGVLDEEEFIKILKKSAFY